MSDSQEQGYLLLTGASSGIGRALALSLSGTYRLILNGRDPGRLQETRDACEAPDRHLCWPFDLGEVGDIRDGLPALLAGHDARVTAFVHCAGLAKMLPLRSVSLEEAQAAMNVNMFAAMEIVRLLMRRNVNQQRLRNVVFISSIASRFGAKALTSYCASKAALDGLMRALAVELAPDVRVNSVLPGAVRTPATDAIFAAPGADERLMRDYPLGVGMPSDICDAVRFLLSDQARWLTGQQIVVDGGRTVNISA